MDTNANQELYDHHSTPPHNPGNIPNESGEAKRFREPNSHDSLPVGRKLNDYGEYEFDSEFEESLIALAIRDNDFFAKYGHHIKDEYFSTQRARDLFLIVTEYRDKYEKEMDKPILKNEVRGRYAKFRHRDDSLEDYFSAVDRMFDLDIQGMVEYAADMVIGFARRRQLKINLRKIAENVMGEEEDLESCRGLVEGALDIGKEILAPKPSMIDIAFPHEAIKGFLKGYADTYSQNFESPYEFWVFNGAVFLGSLIAKRVRLETSLRTEPRLYVACIGKSGVTRKSEAERQTYSFFEEFMQIREGKIGVCHGVGSANGLAKFLQEHPCGILQIDEMRTIMQKTDIKGSVLLETLTSLFDGNYYSNYTKDEAINIKDASLSFIGSTTLKVWEEMFNAPSVGTGLVNRLWIVPGETDKVISRPNIPKSEQLRLMAKLTRILRAYSGNQITTLDMDDDAEELWNGWYREYRMEKTDNDISTRLDTYGNRLMMILAVSEGKTSIHADLVERVISLLNWQRNVRLIFQPKDFDNLLARVEDKIRRAGLVQKEWKRKDLYNKVHAERSGLDTFNRALTNLEKSGVLTGSGRSKGEKIRFLNGG